MTDPFECSNSSVRTTRSDLSENSRNVIINDHWLVLGKIGEGSFGEVFEGQDIKDGTIYAIKRERKSMRHPQLKRESEHYQLLGTGPGVPQCYWYGEFDEFNCIVLDLLGPSLKDIRQCMTPLPFDIIVDLICQMIDIIHHVHQRGLVFRDIKPDNFLFSRACVLPEVKMVKLDRDKPHYQYEVDNARAVFDRWGKENAKLHIIDLGLATRWRDPETDKPLPEAKPKRRNKIGTARYASINVHRGRMHARRDDLEGIAYILLDLILGTLPWTGIQARNSAAGWDRMRGMKNDAYMPEMLDGYPEGLVKFVEYIRKLKFAEDPDYELLKQFLRGSLPGGEHSAPTRSPFDKGEDAKPRQRHRLAADMTPYFGPSSSSRQEKQQVTTDQPPPQDESSAGSSGSGSKKKKWELQEKLVGWYTYKHDEEPWQPEIDWERNEGNENATGASWGEDRPNVSWGPKGEGGGGGDSGWPSSVTRTDSGTGWDCMPSSQEAKGDSWSSNKDSLKMDVDSGWGGNETANKGSTGWGTTATATTTPAAVATDTNASNKGTWGTKTDEDGWRSSKPLTAPSNPTNDAWGAKPARKTSRDSMHIDTSSRPAQQQQQHSSHNVRSRPHTPQQQQEQHNLPSTSHNTNTSNNDNDTSATGKWNAWAASHNAGNQPQSTPQTRRHPPPQRQQPPQQKPLRFGTTEQQQQQSWNSQDFGGGWVSNTDKDGWTTKTSSRTDNRQSQHRGRRKQHW